VSPPAGPQPPSAPWQARAVEIIAAAAGRLWAPIGAKALAYLHRRGFHDDTIRQARLGYHPCTVRDAPARWGLATDHPPVWLPRGIVIPVYQGETPWMLWIRRPMGEPKYVAVAGSRHHDAGIEGVRLGQPAMLVEGRLDALAVQPAAGDLVSPVAVGTRHGTPHTITRLALARPLLLSQDADMAGDAAAVWWQRIFPQAQRRRPTHKDPAAMLELGEDLRAWVTGTHSGCAP